MVRDAYGTEHLSPSQREIARDIEQMRNRPLQVDEGFDDEPVRKERRTGVHARLSDLDEELGRLEERVRLLVEKMDPVLAPLENDVPLRGDYDGQFGTDPSTQSSLSNDIGRYTNRLVELTYFVNMAERRLEL